MEPLHKLTTRLLQKSQEPSLNETPNALAKAFRATTSSNLDRPTITQSHIDRLWGHLSATFGHKWISSYGALPSETWLAGLVDMTPDEIRTGLLACLTWAGDWPPTLPQFRGLCRPRREEAHQVFQRLPEPQAARDRRKATGMDAIARMRDEIRYREWLYLTRRRSLSDFEVHLRHLRRMIAHG